MLLELFTLLEYLEVLVRVLLATLDLLLEALVTLPLDLVEFALVTLDLAVPDLLL